MGVTTKDRKQTRAGRFYDVDGQQFPSVTTILSVIGKPALIAWSAKVEREMVIEAASNLYLDVAGTPPMSKPGYVTTLNDRIGKTKAHQKELSKAAEIGNQAHALIEWNLKANMLMEAGPSPSVTDKAIWAFQAWEKWAKSVDLKPIFIEQVVYSTEHRFAGTLDLFAEVNGVPTVIDWKTGKAVYPEAHLQNASYRHALREMGHGDAKAGMIVRLPKVETDPEFEVVTAMPEIDCFTVFLHTLELWKWSNAQSEVEQAAYNKKVADKEKQEIRDKDDPVLNEYELKRITDTAANSKMTGQQFIDMLRDEFKVGAPSQLRLSQFPAVLKSIHARD